ncbi:MAG: ATP-binding cassette domain-containing protein [Spirochaetes bacterium]|nr:ATP-binding cassette domain-containing protein [Spirochaetota bacterium]MBU1082249.1 ATP-binding cassette domain-containing protein [Spirochaetota bacterium]
MISLCKVRMGYGDRILFKNADFLVRPGDRIGLVGPNGAGKTTVFRLITGRERPDDGDVLVDPGAVVGYFSQDAGEMAGRSVMDEALSGAGRVFELGRELQALEHRMSDPEGPPLSASEMEAYGDLQTEFMHLEGYDLENRAEAILSGLGIGRDRWREPVESFSGGWKMRVALAKILLLNPHCLLIDEPTNHLDVESIVWLEGWLREYKGALVMTSHDREFMTRLCSRTVEVADGAIVSYSGDYDFYLREREIRREQLVASYKRQQAALEKDEEFIARFAARASHAAQVQSRIKMIEKIERVELPREAKAIKFEFGPARRSGDVVVEMKDLAKSWARGDDGAHPVFGGVSGIVGRGQKIAVTGVNGAGKSTLLKVITGRAEPTSGSCQLGAGVEVGYFSQYSGDTLDPGLTVFEELQGRLPRESVGTIKNLLGAFQFSGDDADKRISVLSGGEKTRVMLACLLASPVNFLVLDEPTNHLDIASREVLLEALKDFDGTIMIVSHDRYFLKHLATRVFEVDRGALRVYEGGYEYYQRKAGA